MLIHIIILYISELFNSSMQQDAQEFLNFLLNHVADLLQPPGDPILLFDVLIEI
jgi:ubiquitin C-terminal hydrolase